MNLNKYYRDRWLFFNSKGLWTTKEDEQIYVEELTDSHLCRIPHFLYKKYRNNFNGFIPKGIVLELMSRGYVIDQKNQLKVTQKKERFKPKAKPKINKPIIPKNNNLKEIQKRRNINLLRRK